MVRAAHACFLLLVAASAMLSGCAAYAAPRLTVTDARMTDESPDGLVVSFTVAAANSNREQLLLREIEYTLWLDGRRVFSGSRSPEATLAMEAIQELHLPAAVAIDPDHPRPIGAVPYRIEGTLTYITPGKLAAVLYDSGVPAPTTSFTHTGSVDLGSSGSLAR